jgi:hypothetical protein
VLRWADLDKAMRCVADNGNLISPVGAALNLHMQTMQRRGTALPSRSLQLLKWDPPEVDGHRFVQGGDVVPPIAAKQSPQSHCEPGRT